MLTLTVCLVVLLAIPINEGKANLKTFIYTYVYTVSVRKYSCKYIQPFLHAICLVSKLISSSARGGKSVVTLHGCWNKSYKGSVQTFPFLMRIWAPKTRSYLLAMLVTMAYPMPTLSKKHDLPVCCVVALISVLDSKCSNNVLPAFYLLQSCMKVICAKADWLWCETKTGMEPINS